MEKSRFEELLESLNKGEPIVYEPRSRLEEHLVAIINKEGKEGLGEPRSRAEELLQIHAEQCANGGLGGGSVVIEESAATAVPNEGYVENIYFNTSLTSEEVDRIISEANLEWFTGTAAKPGNPSMNLYFLCNLTSPEYPEQLPILIMDYASVESVPDGSTAYSIVVGGSVPIYISSSVSGDSAGWYQAGLDYIKDLGITIHGEANATCNMGSVTNNMDAPVGLQNEALKMLISSTPFVAGKQPVPNSGYVDTIKFNTSMTDEDIANLINTSGIKDNLLESFMYPILVTSDSSHMFVIQDHSYDPSLGERPYVIVDMATNVVYYMSPDLASDGQFTGWNPDFNGVIEVNKEVVTDMGDGVIVGSINDKLTDLVYIGTDLYRKELSGTYEPVTVEVTENSEIDLTTYMDNQKMPIKVNVEVEGSIVVEESASTAVPNEGYVDAIHINNSLSDDEVANIITNANLPYIDAYGMTLYPVFMDIDTKAYIAVVDATSILNTGVPAYQIINLGTEELLYSTPELTSLGVSISGWNSNFNGVIDVKAEAHSDLVTYATQNDKLVDLVYIGSEPFRKELSGTYEAVTVEVTENSEIDLTTYMDEQKMPIKVNVEVEGSGGDGGSVVVEAEASEPTPLPTSGILEKVYVNTNLSTEEIKAICQQLTFELSSTCHCFILSTNNFSITINGAYDSSSPNEVSSYMIYISGNCVYRETNGWFTNTANVYEVNEEILSVGTQNHEILVNLFSTTPFNDEPFSKELSGAYEAITVDITENAEVDLTEYWDGQKMPISVNVEVTPKLQEKNITLTGTKETITYDDGYDGLSQVTVNVSSGGVSALKGLLDTTKSSSYLFSAYEGTSIDGLISYDDTSNVTNMSYMFFNCPNLISIPELNTSKAKNMSYMFRNCTNLITITLLDVSSLLNVSNMFNNCTNLTNLTLKNLKRNLPIGSGTSWGHLLSVDSLVGICKECIDIGSSLTLTMGSANTEKLASVYVKLTGAAEEDEANPKLPCEVCESTDEGAMTIVDYMALKNWVIQ